MLRGSQTPFQRADLRSCKLGSISCAIRKRALAVTKTLVTNLLHGSLSEMLNVSFRALVSSIFRDSDVHPALPANIRDFPSCKDLTIL